MGQSLGAAVILQPESPNVILHFLEFLFGMLDVDLTPPLPDHFCLEGVVPDPGHGIIDVVTQGVVEIEEGKLSRGVGANWMVGIVRGGMNVLKISVVVAFQLPIDDGVIRPFDLDIMRLHRLPAWQGDLEVDKVYPLVQGKACRRSIDSIIVPASQQVSILPGLGIIWSAISSHILLASRLIWN